MSATFSSVVFKYGVFLPVVTVRGERVFHYLRELEESQWADPRTIEKTQEAKLGALLRHAYAHVPFYRDRADVEVDRGASLLDQLRSLPCITKHDLIHSNQALASTNHRGPVTVKTTGGSTGQAVTVRKSRTATALETAANWRGFRWEGIDIGDRQGRFWGVPVTASGRFRARMIDWVAHRRRYSAFQFSDADMARYLEELGRFRPQYLYGYASMLRCMAEYLVDRNQTFPSDLRAVVSTSEPLTPPDRRLFQQAFSAPVFNEYGCGELGTIAHECEKGRLHVHAENLLVEIQPVDGSGGPDGAGEVVVTELNNLAMPLIRYRLGDFAAMSTEPCPCGRTLPTLREVFGRSYDMVRNRDGQKLHGEFFMYIFEDTRRQGLGVDAFQVVQHDYDHLTVKVVPATEFGAASETFIRDRIRAGLGDTVDVAFERVSEIRREKSGKMRLVIGMPS
jgi:phenylacetate-CoA ligase